ncbi:peroxidase-related enzyme [Brevibacterium sp. JSBI002]|uniref:peroxidase-related enzyme n=1 Tax=Brevibacterium sp. JSBI002 TaxID=2886045 RepID=UPI00222FE182|nr:peroxidase-related enzyme [Brevibacterium sp. JSBI002]UZD62718.1 peroxidase-related enzyme [Brevibacterium sp. JSBI002]
MSEEQKISFLPVPDRDDVPEAVTKLWDKSEEAMGFVPNVFRTQALNSDQFLAWWKYFNLLVNKDGYLSNAEREMIGVVVSGINGCTYCAVSHGAVLREFSQDPVTANLVAINWRQADLSERQRAIAEYADLLTKAPETVEEDDLQPMRDAGLDDHEIMEAVQVIGMFNMTNRISSALGFVPNTEYHSQARK